MAQTFHISNKALLVILDGYGINKKDNKNAILHAYKPNLDYLFTHFPFTTIEAGGESVGLPKGVSGNSEVGHMNLGAGRPVRQDLVRINESIASDTFKNLEKFKKLIKEAKARSKRIHLFGLLSDGGVHSHIDHLDYIVNQLAKEDELEIYFHAFMDGRDTPPANGEKYLKRLESMPKVKLASMQGRSIGMDRDRRWEKIEKCYKTIIGKGKLTKLSPEKYLANEYKAKRTDEFIKPVLFSSEYALGPDDCIFFINFRPDRAIQLTQAMNLPEFSEFKRPFIPPYYLCMSPYIPEDMELPVLFDKEKISGTLSEYLSSQGKAQIKIAETEKYAHVTFFFNGGEKKPFKNEEHILVPSPKAVKTYDEKPEMSAYEVTEKLISKIENDDADFYLVNYANSDMVGHTGKYEAAIKAVEALDDCVGKLMNACKKKGLTMLLTADHGNSDQMVYEDGSPHTSHTGAPVPFVLYNEKLMDKNFDLNIKDGALKDIAPTILHILGLEKPKEFTGSPIFK